MLNHYMSRDSLDPESLDPECVDSESLDPESLDPECVESESLDPESLDPLDVGDFLASWFAVTCFSRREFWKSPFLWAHLGGTYRAR